MEKYALIFIIILFSLIFIIFNILYKRTNHYKNSVIQLKKFIDGVPDNLEIVNTGSTYARYAFDFSSTSLKGFNFGLQPQSISYDYKIIRQFTPSMSNNCIILITIPNLVFGFLDYDNDQSNTKYYYFLKPDNIIGYSKAKHFVRVVFPLLDNWRNVIRIFKDVKLENHLDLNSNPMNEEQITAHARERVEGWKKQFKLNNTLDASLPNEIESMFYSTTKLLNEMIEYCLDKHFLPILIVPPTSCKLNKLMSKDFMKKVLFDNINRANVQKVPVLNYLYDERFQDTNMYINSDMLNKAGRIKFTQTVIDDLKNIGYLKGQTNE